MKPDDLVVTPMGVRFMGRRFPCTIGRSGVIPAGKKREGDGATPAGVHRIVGMLQQIRARFALEPVHAERLSLIHVKHRASAWA